jgi:hypothetical protein
MLVFIMKLLVMRVQTVVTYFFLNCDMHSWQNSIVGTICNKKSDLCKFWFSPDLIYLSVCMFMCMYAYTFVRTLYMCAYIHMHVHMYKHEYMLVHVHACMYLSG